MLGEFGQLLLSMSVVFSLCQGIFSFYGLKSGEGVYERVGMWSLFVQSSCVILSMGVLIFGFVVTDLSLEVVAGHSHILQPLFYKVTGVWGNHEGSLLLWNVLLSLWTCFVIFRGGLMGKVRGYACSFFGFFSFFMLLMMTVTSSPFSRLVPSARFGGELNPILQDPTLAIHPPLLYVGYVGLSVVCLYMMSLLVSGVLRDKEVSPRVWRLFHILTTTSWFFLTGGIALGSAWAYHELGWGGFWFWDPVENTSLMPWLIATAIIHAGNVARRTRQHQFWIAVLTLFAFLLSLLGTFLVRSGLLISPHSFASDPSRGVALLLLLCLVAFWGMWILVRYGGGFGVVLPSRFWSRENMMFTGSLVLSSICGGIAVGTLSPIVVEVLSGEVLTIGHPYYNTLFVPMGFLLLFLCGAAPLMNWRKNYLRDMTRRMSLAGFGGIFFVVLGLFLWGFEKIVVICAYGFAVWLFLTLFEAVRRQKGSVSVGMVCAHFGLGLMTVAIASMTGFDEVKSVRLGVGEETLFGGDRLYLESVRQKDDLNYTETKASILVVREGGESFMLYPSRRLYRVSGVETVEPYVRTSLWRDDHAILGDFVEEGLWVFRFYRKPMVLWLWLGSFFMVLGGFWSTVVRLRMR